MDKPDFLEWADRNAASMAFLLLNWYDGNQRSLPWRQTSDPYAIWISEIMLQQTQVDAVIPYYLRFLKHFPTLEDLARAPLETVLKLWENMGYYSRARHLHQAARIILESYSGRLPENLKDLTALPGIGAYTAGAILSIAFGKPMPAVDGNVKRVLSRIFAMDYPLNAGSTGRLISVLAERLIPNERPGQFNQALMDLGAGLCRPGIPHCPDCPLSRHCRAYAEGRQHLLPVTGKRMTRPRKEAAAVVIRDSENRLLLIQRSQDGFLGGLWTFPGGMISPGDIIREALEKRCREALGIVVAVTESLMTIFQAYTHFQLTLHVFQGKILPGHRDFPKPLHGRWVPPEDLGSLPFSRVEIRILKALFPETFQIQGD